MRQGEDDADTEWADRLERLEARADFLTEWQAHVAPSVARLVRDQEYRDHRLAQRAQRWKVWGVRLSVTVAGVALVGSLARTFASGLRVPAARGAGRARGGVIVGAEVTWPQVALALVAALPACVSAFYGRRSSVAARAASRKLTTGNEKTVGAMVTEIHGEASRQGTEYDTHVGTGGS
jgi:hypothetical protein